MKREIGLAFIAILFMAAMISVESKTRGLKPVKSWKTTKISVSGKDFKYYYIPANASMAINVEGPGELRIISRAALSSKKRKVDYSFSYVVDGGKKQKARYKDVKISNKAKFKTRKKDVPGRKREKKIKLGRGYHTISIKADKKGTVILAKFLFKPSKEKKIKWIEFDPSSNSLPVNLIVNEETYQYYRFTKEKPLETSIIGPTKLRVFTRVENSYDMRGRVNYRLQVKEDGKVKNTYLISSRRSEVAVYKNNDSLVPGKAREIFINVPKGRHKYQIIPMDRSKNSLIGRLYFPESDAKLEE